MLKITLPKTITAQNIDQVINCFKGFDQKDSIIIDFSQTTWVEPIGFSLIVGFINYCVFFNKKVKYKPSNNSKLVKYFNKSGFNKLFNINASSISFKDCSTNVPLKRFETNLPVNQSFIDNLVNIINFDTKLSDDSKVTIKSSLFELFTNVKDHSSSQSGYIALGQMYPKKQKVCIAVADNGIGMLKTLNRQYKNIQTEEEAIKQSIEAGVTCKSIEKNAGMGLHTISLQAFQLDIISNSTMCSYNNKKWHVKYLKERYPGVIINIEIDPAINNFETFVDTYENEEWF